MSDPAQYLPGPFQIVGLFAVCAVVLALTGLGAYAGGRRRLPEADLMAGWGAVVMLFVAFGVATEVPFRLLAYPLFAVAAAAVALAWHRDRRVVAEGAVKVAALGAPLVLVVSAMSASQWDEFSQWLWSARHLLDVDAFPRAGLKENPASFPGYPYALPLVMYLTGRLAGTFVENSGILFNVFVLLSVALLFARLIAMGRGGDASGPLGLYALALLAAFVFPPFVVPKVAFTTYAEVGTAAATAFGGVLGWLVIQALTAGDRTRARAVAVQLGLAMAVLVFLKQANLVLLVLLFAGVAMAGLRTPGVSPVALFKSLGLALLPPLTVYLAWRYHVAAHLTGREFRIMPISEWTIALVPKTLSAMLGIALRKSGFFGLMVVFSGFALKGLARYRGPFDGLAIIAGCVFVGYNAFLLFAYVAIFGAWEAERAVSYWRYNMHLGLLGGAVTVYGLALLWRRHGAGRMRMGLASLAVPLVLAGPVLLIQKIRFDLHAPKQYVRQVGAELATLLPRGARLAVIDPLDTGFYVKLVRYEVYPAIPVVMEHYLHHAGRDLAGRLRRTEATHAWVHTQTDEVRAAFEAALPEGASYLLEASGDGWGVRKYWPYPGYRLPADVPD